jgi:3-dehydroquinate synthase
VEVLKVADQTEVLIGRSLPDPLLPQRPGRERAAVLTQPGPTPVALEVAESIKSNGLKVEVIGLPDREEAKTLAVAESVYEALARLGLGRSDTVLGVGGGSVTDLAGYVAATWLRGVEVVHVPTTLLGAVDASIGGKTGVNLAGKNLVGAFWHPTRVVIDIDTLSVLPPSLFREGMAEVLKAGLIGDAELFDLLRSDGMGADIESLVTRSIAVKARIVSEDEREEGIRAHLNFGHTIGHAIEFASPLSHGESVALGSVAAAHISAKRLGFDDVEAVESTIAGLGLPVRIGGLEHQRILDLLRLDKKRDASGLRMVLLTEIGKPTIVHVDSPDIEIGLSAIGL